MGGGAGYLTGKVRLRVLSRQPRPDPYIFASPSRECGVDILVATGLMTVFSGIPSADEQSRLSTCFVQRAAEGEVSDP